MNNKKNLLIFALLALLSQGQNCQALTKKQAGIIAGTLLALTGLSQLPRCFEQIEQEAFAGEANAAKGEEVTTRQKLCQALLTTSEFPAFFLAALTTSATTLALLLEPSPTPQPLATAQVLLDPTPQPSSQSNTPGDIGPRPGALVTTEQPVKNYAEIAKIFDLPENTIRAKAERVIRRFLAETHPDNGNGTGSLEMAQCLSALREALKKKFEPQTTHQPTQPTQSFQITARPETPPVATRPLPPLTELPRTMPKARTPGQRGCIDAQKMVGKTPTSIEVPEPRGKAKAVLSKKTGQPLNKATAIIPGKGQTPIKNREKNTSSKK